MRRHQAYAVGRKKRWWSRQSEQATMCVYILESRIRSLAREPCSVRYCLKGDYQTCAPDTASLG